MTSNSKILVLAILALVLAACGGETAVEEGAAPPSAGAGGRPNIIFIMSDDHAFQAIGAYGSVLNETPNIDRLADEGMRFDRAFVSNSICSPSRAVILTGKHSHLNGVRNNIGVFDNQQQTFPKILRQAGYQTAMIGKWHLKSDPTGFDYWRVLPGQGFYYQPEFRTPEGTVTLQGYVTDLITDMAIEWLDSGRDPAQPFMLMYQHKAPHREWLPSQDHLRDFKGAPLPEPATLFDDYAGRGTAAAVAEMRIAHHMGFTNDGKIEPDLVEALGYEDFLAWYERAYKRSQARFTEEEKTAWDAVYGPINDDFAEAGLEGDDLTRWKFQRYMQDYLASINSVDENIGRLLEYLDESGLADNTVVVYTSDQGFYLGEHGWFDKRFMYEESFRTPLIVRWPGVVAAGAVSSELVQNLDFAQTLLDIAGVEAPGDMQGLSLVPVLRGGGIGGRDALYYHYYEFPGIHAVKRHYGIRTDRYKLIHFYYDIDEWELYDLEADPQEMRNVYGQEAYADVQADLHARLEELRVLYGDSDELSRSFLDSDLAWHAQNPEVPPHVNELSPAEQAAGFRLLFDGETLAGWHGYGGGDPAARWQVRDGALVIDLPSDQRTDLVTDAEFDDFELRLEWKISPGGNSGFMFNVSEAPEYNKPWRTGPEIQILDNVRHPDSAPTHRAGELYDLVGSRVEMSRPVGQWNRSRLRVEDGRVRHWLNGTLVFDVQMWDAAWDELVAESKFGAMPGFGTYRRGRIDLQDHGDAVAFRSIRIREL
jgi:arylsulfatase A-like enzyme